MGKIQFTDPETNEVVEFFVVEQTTLNGCNYLLVTDAEDGDSDAYIFKETKQDDEEVIYDIVEDDVEFEAVSKIFEELLDEDVDLEY